MCLVGKTVDILTLQSKLFGLLCFSRIDNPTLQATEVVRTLVLSLISECHAPKALQFQYKTRDSKQAQKKGDRGVQYKRDSGRFV